jgi:hypothetical protein
VTPALTPLSTAIRGTMRGTTRGNRVPSVVAHFSACAPGMKYSAVCSANFPTLCAALAGARSRSVSSNALADNPDPGAVGP